MKNANRLNIRPQGNTYSLSHWGAVANFLHHLLFDEEKNVDIHIVKDHGGPWTIKIKGPKKRDPRKTVKLTTSGKGVGLFDLNW